MSLRSVLYIWAPLVEGEKEKKVSGLGGSEWWVINNSV